MMHPQAAATFHGPFLFVNPDGKRFTNEATWVQGEVPGRHGVQRRRRPWLIPSSMPTGRTTFWARLSTAAACSGTPSAPYGS